MSFGDYKGDYTVLLCATCFTGVHGEGELTTSVDLRDQIPRGDYIEVAGAEYRICVSGTYDATTLPLCSVDDTSAAATVSTPSFSSIPGYMLDTSIRSVSILQDSSTLVTQYLTAAGRYG